MESERLPVSAHNSRTPATLLAVLLLGFGLLHVYWGLGGTWALDQVLGGPAVPRPPKSSIWMVAIVLVAFAAGASALARRQTLPLLLAIAARVSVWVVAAAAAMAGLVNLMGTTLVERAAIAPFALVILALALLTLRAARRGL
jgi:hypothetical protein